MEKDRYADAEVIEQAGGVDVSQPGIYRQARLVRVPTEKYPLIVVQDEVEVTADKQVKLVKQQAVIADHVMFKPKAGVPEATILAAIQKLGGTVRRKMPASGIWLIALPQPSLKSVPEALAKLSALPNLTAAAEPDYVVHANAVLPGDSSFGQLWGLHNTGQSGGTVDADIDAPEAWEITTGSRNVLVGVIDTGIDHTHPDLVANMWTNPNEIAANNIDDDNNGYIDDVRGWDFANNDNNPMDDNLHGTHCAGTIGGVGDNSQGVTGVCWQVSLVGLKFLSSSGGGTTSDAVEAIAYGTLIGVDITSNSWGGGGYSSLMKSAIDAANTAGILFVAAAGNESTNSDNETNYPSGYECANVIAVAATTRNDVLSYFSNYGATTVDLAAPGSEIYSTAPGGGYALLSGTSMATPHVAGACALLLAHNPTLPPMAVRSTLLSSVDPVPALTGRCISGGRLNVNRALQRSSELVVEPFGDVVFSHPLGSPVSSEGQIVALTNHSRGSVNWTTEVDHPWAQPDLAAGMLAAGQRAEVQVKLVAEEIALLAGGLHTATLTITDLSTGRRNSRTIQLDLVPPAVAEFNLDTDPGWPRSGQWAYGTPTGAGGTSHGHPDPTAGATGANVLGINLNGDYSTSVGGPWWLTAGPFDLSERKSTRLAFQRWLNSDYEPWVSAMIEVSTNGTQWTTLWRNGFAFMAESAWRRQELDLSAIADRQPRVWVRWGHKVGRSTEVWACSGWNLDDIQILGQLDRALTLTGVGETSEGDAPLNFTLQVHPVPTQPQTIILSVSPADELIVPPSVTLAAGQDRIMFPVQALDDGGIDGTQNVTLTATHEDWPAGRVKLDVHDNESAALTLTLPATVREGSINVFGTVSIDAPADRTLRVHLTSDDKTTVNVPSSVTIAAGQQSATFPLMVSDDAYINPLQTVTLRASVPHWPAAEATTSFLDDEPRELSLELPAQMQENLAGTFTGTVRVGGVLAAPLTVELSSADILRLTVTASITIPAGTSGQTFSLTPGDDSVIDGVQQVEVTARAPGFKDGTASATIYDNETPALPFAPSPVDGQERTSPKAVLTWSDMPYTGGTPTSWDIYFGTSKAQAMTRKVGSMNRRQWPLGRMQRGMTYFWRVVAKRGHASHPSPVWSFTIPSTGVPVRYAWSPLATTQTVNQPFAVAVTGYDEFGNVATLDGGPLLITTHGVNYSGGVVVAPDVSVELRDGRWTGTVRVPNLPGTKIRLQARNLTDGGVTGESSAFQVKGSTAAILAVRADPSFTSESTDKQTAKFWIDAGRVPLFAQTIHLSSLDHTELLDGTTTLTARSVSTEATLRVVDDDIVDGPQNVAVEVWAPGWSSGYGTVQVRDNEANELTLTLPDSISENAGTATATISVQHAPENDVRISLRSDFAPSLISSIKVPAEVILRAGETSVDLAITMLQNTVLDFDRTASITAEVPGWGSTTRTMTVIDDESRDITLMLQPSLTEGAVPVGATFYLSARLMAPLTLTLSATNAAQVSLPATVTLPAGATSGSFSVGAVDDSDLDGSQDVDISLSAPGLTTAVKRFVVDDNDAHHFTVTTLPKEVHVGASTYITVTARDVNDRALGLVRGPVTLSAHDDDGPVPCTPASVVESIGSGMAQHSIRLMETGRNVRLQITGPNGSSESAPFDVVRGPEFGVSPGSLALNVPLQHTTSRTLTLSNTGTHDLEWSAMRETFVNLSPASGILAPGDTAMVTVTISAAGAYLLDTTYRSTLTFTTNDGLQSKVSVPVDMRITPPVTSFRWAGLPARPLVNAPNSVTLTALNAQGQTVADYDGVAGLGSTLTANRDVGSKGAVLTSDPFGLGSKTTRTQMIYLQSEVGSAALLQGLAIDMAVLPSLYYRHINVTVRLKHTTKRSTSEMGAFESDGWTTVFSSSATLDVLGWNRLPFSRPFAYNGTDHLMVDITTTASYYGSYSRAYGRTTSPARVLTLSTSNNYGDPLKWTLAPWGSPVLPNLRFEVSDSVLPARTGRFVNGVWTGDVTITQVQKDQRLIAVDGDAMSYSPYFNVEETGTASLIAHAPLIEGQGLVTGAVKLQVTKVSSQDTAFSLVSSDSMVLGVPAVVILPAGGTEVSIPITLPDDTLLEGVQQVGLTFSAPGFRQTRQDLTVQDNETAILSVQLPDELHEGDTDQTLTVSLDRNADARITVALSSSSSRVVVPEQIAIPAGSSSAMVSITLADNSILDGDEDFTVTASSEGMTSGTSTGLLRDDEQRALGISWLPSSVNENAVLFFSSFVSLGGITNSPVSVTIESDSPSRVPSMTVVVPAGESTTSFTVRPLDNHLPDGQKAVTLTAKADGFTSSPSQTITVLDDDPHHFEITSITSPQIAHVPISLHVVARDVDGNAIQARKPEFYFQQESDPLPFSTVTDASYVDGAYQPRLSVDAYASQARLHVRDALSGTESVSNVFVVSHGPARGFDWSFASSPVDNQPVAITLTARDTGGNVAETFSGTAALSLGPPDFASIGSGPTYTLWSPLGTAYPAVRTQMLIKREELGTLPALGAMTVQVTSRPAVPMSSYKIRLKPTTRATFSPGDQFDAIGWTTVYSAPLSISAVGPLTLQFQERYLLDKNQDLLVDLSFQNNTGAAYNGSLRAYALTANHLLIASGSGSPDNFTQGVGNNFRPQVTFSSGTPAISFTPAQTGTFVNGVWTGFVTLTPATKAVRLQAANGNITGVSPLFDIQSATP